MAALPEFVQPMLARLGAPFDSDEHLFEVKWDGIRTLSFAEGGDYRLSSRNRSDQKARYPEFAFLAELSAGVVLDGEIVVLKDDKPDFQLVLKREQVRDRLKIDHLAQTLPAAYVVFDLLYLGFESIMSRPLTERRERLAEVVAACGNPRLVLSEGIVGGGTAFFEEAGRRDLEGVVAKRLDSTYQPGRRTGAWMKIKTTQETVCAVIGYLAEGNEVRSLILAARDEGGELRYVGRVGSGLSASMRRKLHGLCGERPRATPLVACPADGSWIEPGLYCRVSFLERTDDGHLRAPVFRELMVDEG
ncbi:MAG: DNA ligase [Planctomycetota bacterium]|nr:DNA ligase [Planctomycetota bacterium]